MATWRRRRARSRSWPTNVEALNCLSAAYAALGETARALATIDRALALGPPAAIEQLLRQRRELLRR